MSSQPAPVVKFFIPGWDLEATEAHHGELAAIENYVRAASAEGFTDGETAEDIEAQWGNLGRISVQTVRSPYQWTVVVDIDDRASGPTGGEPPRRGAG